MNLVPGTTRLTADGLVGSSGKSIRVFDIHLVSGATASTCTLENGTDASGTAYIQIDGVASKGVTLGFAGGVRFPDGCFLDADANISYATIVFTEEF